MKGEGVSSSESGGRGEKLVAREPYIHDDDSAMTVRQHASRTADKQAGWFLPYLRPGMTLLDCGCASGSITVGLAEAVAPGRVHGVDISEVEIGRAIARAEQQNIENISFTVGNVYELDFSDNSFDAVFSHNVLEHLAHPDHAIQEMRRVLKPGGMIGLRDFDIGGLLFEPETELFKQFVDLYEADWQRMGGHPRLGRRLSGMMDKAGFAEVVASASYEAYSRSDLHMFVTDVLIGRLSEEVFATRVVGCGMATHDVITAMIDELSAWQVSPGAFLALAHAEVVGRKPDTGGGGPKAI